jgi:hypothetical protein
MPSIPELTRLLAAIQTWQDGLGQPGGRAEAGRRLDEAHKLLDEVSNMLTDMRRELLGSGRTAIRAIYEQLGEFSAAVELRRLFPAITDTAQARACARTIAGWKPLPVPLRPVKRRDHPRRS